MASVKVSPKYQVVLPREVRESMKIRPGERLEVFRYGRDRIELVRVRSVRELRGAYKGIDTAVEREPDRP